MPTPSQETIASTPTSSYIDRADLSRASFTTCPPEVDRERTARHATGSSQDLSDAPSHSDSDVSVQDDRTSSSTATSPEPETAPDHVPHTETSIRTTEHDRKSKDVALDALIGRAEATTSSKPETDEPSSSSPQYLYYPRSQERYRDATNATSSFLRPGSRFVGTQQSDRQVYEVQVEIKDVDMAESFLCGYLRIQGLTDDHPTLTTFFEGEIIGPKHLFKTTHPSWGSNEKVDLQHWARFPAWKPLAKSAKSPNFSLKNYQQREHLFMRWKEYFLVPDHNVKTISGASFEGFYYICFNQCDGTVSGIYFHAKSEKYQQLELEHVPSHGCLAAVEFR